MAIRDEISLNYSVLSYLKFNMHIIKSNGDLNPIFPSIPSYRSNLKKEQLDEIENMLK